MLISVLKYNFKMYMKSHKYIMPFFIFIIYMVMAYSIRLLDIVGSMVSSAAFLFALMTWIGFTYYSNIELIAEEVLILKLKSHTRYWISKIIFMGVVGAFLSILSVGLPIIYNLICNVFKYPVTFSDIFVSFIIHMFLSIIGALIGMLLQPRIISNRKMAILGAIFIVLMSIIKGPVINEVPYSKYVMWIFPPINEVSTAYLNLMHFNIPSLIMPLIIMIIYIFIESFILIKRMKKVLF
ncbi:hypothetical protein [Clostridium beijerinckii]|jgi:hypothetical protein|uniref:Uncharacterized protein n=3 Tax=Clostridium beijerinckii TaxID=1520 RepID=A0AAE2RQF8_CLOBE|nr:hypothetical protein [Clostridium beijerinckii]ABR35557.1 hypothetical protein Cbei_3432 [Clostridium beijerinckii NCIMB 8052]AIU01481.1 hypothetical protein Cbs_3432 [Clostridium beijerinckii ATCC 35702]MBF7809805.1 hypothetical protein [Clostridium beijerinckii]NRT84440.1 hypothetical protein [Clostridium beijerinckii]NYC67751.1 hypothetical protein [Clostridium beijerinckii]